MMQSSTRLDHTMVALADPTRRAILERLQHGDASVTELAGPFPISLNSVSKHIKLLERAGLVRRRRDGRGFRLSFEAAPLDEAAKWIEERRAFWSARLTQLAAVLDEDDHREAISDEKRKDRP